MVTAKTSELDVVRGLDSGADDYVTKPFGIMEFISRVKAVFRRIEQPVQQLSFQGIEMDDEKRLVTVDGRVVELTFKEYELLKFLLINQGIVLSRDKIMDKVWGTYYEGEKPYGGYAHQNPAAKAWGKGSAIKTVRNVGYKIE